jgi:phage terminase large subunit GpA-like protein
MAEYRRYHSRCANCDGNQTVSLILKYFNKNNEKNEKCRILEDDDEKKKISSAHTNLYVPGM